MSANKKKVLIIRFSSIGDIVLTTPVVRCIQQQWDAEVHFLTKKSFAGLLFNNPYIHKVHILEETPITTLKNIGFDHVIDLQKNLTSTLLGLRIPGKYTTFNKLNIQKWILVNLKINVLPDKHLIDRYFVALRSLGIVNDGRGCDYFIDTNMVADELKGITDSSYVVIALGAAHGTKRISLKKCREIISFQSHSIVLLGGNDVMEMAVMLKSEFPMLVNKAGKCNLHESAFLIQHANVVYTGDTGMMHIAAALQKKIIVLWGNTVPSFGMYPYYGSGHADKSLSIENNNISCRPCSKLGHPACPRGHFKCMEELIIDPAAIEMMKNA